MDWSKAKSVLIILFLGLNIFLAFNIFISTDTGGVSKKNILNTQSILNARGYVLKCEIPTTTRSYKLDYENGVFDKQKVIGVLIGDNYSIEKVNEGVSNYKLGSKLLKFEQYDSTFSFEDSAPSEGLEVSNISSVDSYMNSLISGLGLAASSYCQDLYETNRDNSIHVVYRQKHKDSFIYNSYIEAVVSKQGLMRLKGKLIYVKVFSSQIKVTPVYQILLSSLSKVNGEEITGIDIGYRCMNFDRTSMEYSEENPVWRISIKGRVPRYFTALDGVEIKH